MSTNAVFSLNGPCPLPFLSQFNYPSEGGFVDGRMCMPIPEINATCCIPCPVSDWIYSDGFEERSEVASWMNLAAACVTAFLLLSYMVLDVKWTHRHYLSVCLAIGVLFMEVAFILPLITTPEQCHNDITPNGMGSDVTCAVTGSLLLFGGWCAVIWVFWRALSIHLQICWQVVPGKKFFYSALIIGWGIPAAGLATLLTVTGVSYRFGSVCHINHHLGLQDYWGPLMTFTGLSMIIQFVTIGYCVHVFIKSLLHDQSPKSNGTSDRPSIQLSSGGSSARQTYRRVMKVIELQWRGAATVIVVLGESIFFSVIFVSMDNASQINETLKKKAQGWFLCLVASQGNKNKCLPETKNFVMSETTVLAVLVCLSMTGFWLLLFFGRWSMILGWKDLIKRRMISRKKFEVGDHHHLGTDSRTYEMLDSSRSQTTLKVPSTALPPLSPTSIGSGTPVSPYDKLTHDYFDGKSPAQIYAQSISPHGYAQSPDPQAKDYAR